ncbi:unnamed protein product [Somion occarium]|uniref:Uncharacterized protein n=1 Tax=Somion occarium TaxID=3059160 RepID=A0ABP1DRY8_9APHY
MYAPLLLHLAQHPWLRDVRHVDEDIVRRMAVERCAQTLLVKVMPNETDGSAKDEKTVQGTNLYQGSLFWCEGTTVSKEIDEANGDTPVDVQDQLKTLRHLLDSKGIVEETVAREVLANYMKA